MFDVMNVDMVNSSLGEESLFAQVAPLRQRIRFSSVTSSTSAVASGVVGVLQVEQDNS